MPKALQLLSPFKYPSERQTAVHLPTSPRTINHHLGVGKRGKLKKRKRQLQRHEVSVRRLSQNENNLFLLSSNSGCFFFLDFRLFSITKKEESQFVVGQL
jgi:hypothetical protein